MSDSAPTLTRGEQYIVFYKGGPYDGQDDTRISTDGSWDAELQVLVAVDGKETELTYTVPPRAASASRCRSPTPGTRPTARPQKTPKTAASSSLCGTVGRRPRSSADRAEAF